MVFVYDYMLKTEKIRESLKPLRLWHV